MTIGVNIIGEDEMDSLAASMKTKGTNEGGDKRKVVKIEVEDVEVAPEWDRSVEGELSNMSKNM